MEHVSWQLAGTSPARSTIRYAVSEHTVQAARGLEAGVPMGMTS